MNLTTQYVLTAAGIYPGDRVYSGALGVAAWLTVIAADAECVTVAYPEDPIFAGQPGAGEQIELRNRRYLVERDERPAATTEEFARYCWLLRRLDDNAGRPYGGRDYRRGLIPDPA